TPITPPSRHYCPNWQKYLKPNRPSPGEGPARRSIKGHVTLASPRRGRANGSDLPAAPIFKVTLHSFYRRGGPPRRRAITPSRHHPKTDLRSSPPLKATPGLR